MKTGYFLSGVVLWKFASSAKNPSDFGGMINIEFMQQSTAVGQSIFLTRDNSTMFTHQAPVPPPGGIWGELVPFYPLDACTSLKPSNYTRNIGKSLQLTTVGPSPHVIALVARGHCSFEEKFDNVDDIPNVIGLIMFDIPDGQNLSNDIDISTFEKTRIPGFLIDHKTGIDLIKQVNMMRATPATNVTDSKWIKVTLEYVPLSGPIADFLQYVILAIMGALTIAFISSVYMHYRIYRMQRDLGQSQLNEARAAITIDESFLEKLPVRRYATIADANGAKLEDGAGVGLPGQAPNIAIIEIEDIQRGLPHACANETCPICLDEFTTDEMINELPCGHNYHILCIQPWLQHRSPECPLCKADVRDAYIELDPVDPTTAQLKLWKRIKDRLGRTFCCGPKVPAIDRDAQPRMTEVSLEHPSVGDIHV